MDDPQPSAMQPPVSRQVRCKLADLVDAFDGASPYTAAYLDLDTGKVIEFTSDTRDDLESIYSDLPEDLTDEEHTQALLAALDERDTPDWMRDELLQADAVEHDFGARYLPLPDRDSSDGYQDMAAFIETVTQPQFARRLWDAIGRRGAFRRFKYTLERDPSERERWFAFKAARVRERVLEWLANEGLDPVEPDTT